MFVYPYSMHGDRVGGVGGEGNYSDMYQVHVRTYAHMYVCEVNYLFIYLLAMYTF